MTSEQKDMDIDIVKTIEIFDNTIETIAMYYKYLHLGFFYTQLSKRVDLSPDAMNIYIGSGSNPYILEKQLIQNYLKDIYNESPKSDVFPHLILNNAIRGISMAMFEALRSKEIRTLFSDIIFSGDSEGFNNFYEITKFIRHTFSHNMRDSIELKRSDYEGNSWNQINRLTNKGKSSINFFFDYAQSPIQIMISNYTLKIDVELDRIQDGVIYTDIISEYQTLSFIEFCYNSMVCIRGKLIW